MASYAAAGVDIAAGDRAVELMKASVKRTAGPRCWRASAGSPGCSSLDLARYPQPVLASSTDGVGTKIAIAQAVDRHDTIGIDLVAMVVDDLVVVGAEPLFLSDYIATGKVVPEKIAAIVSGIAEGCVQAGCALVGGETAEHPGVMRADEYDVSGTGVGVVNADGVLGADRVQAWRRADRARVVRAALQRLLAGAPRSGRDAAWRWMPRPALLGGRTLADELLDADPDLRPGLPGAGRRVRRARVRPHHRRRAGRQPARACCRRRSTRSSTGPPGRRRRSSS